MADPYPDKKAAPRRLGVREFQGNLGGFLTQARDGSSFLITSRDEVLAEIHPPSLPVRPRRRPGVLRGGISMASDFDDLSPETIAAMEGDEA